MVKHTFLSLIKANVSNNYEALKFTYFAFFLEMFFIPFR